MSMESKARSKIRVSSDNGRHWLWDSHRPLAIGHPSKWVLESKGSTLRLTELSKPGVQKVSIYEVDTNSLDAEKATQLGPFALRKSRAVTAAFRQTALSPKKTPYVYTVVGEWVLETTPLDRARSFLYDGKPALQITPRADSFDISFQNEKLNLKKEELEKREFHLGKNTWKFGYVDSSVAVPVRKMERDPEDDRVKRVFTSALLSLLLIFILFQLSSKLEDEKKPEDRPLIPPQYAKVLLRGRVGGGTPGGGGPNEVMQRSKGAQSASSASPSPTQSTTSGGDGAPAAAKGITTGKVSPAQTRGNFRGNVKNLEKTLSGLLKGGINNFLDQAKGVRGGSPIGTEGLSKGAGEGAGKGQAFSLGGGTQVAGLGGSEMGGAGDPNGKGVGYGKGEYAQVPGQGRSFISTGSGDADVDEGLTKAEVGAVIHAHRKEIKYCYESASLRKPNLEGRLPVLFRIQLDGRVSEAKGDSSTLPDDFLEKCLISRLKTWQFPKPRGNKVVNVNYPFTFKVLGKEE